MRVADKKNYIMNASMNMKNEENKDKGLVH